MRVDGITIVLGVGYGVLISRYNRKLIREACAAGIVAMRGTVPYNVLGSLVMDHDTNDGSKSGPTTLRLGCLPQPLGQFCRPSAVTRRADCPFVRGPDRRDATGRRSVAASPEGKHSHRALSLAHA